MHIAYITNRKLLLAQIPLDLFIHFNTLINKKKIITRFMNFGLTSGHGNADLLKP